MMSSRMKFFGGAARQERDAAEKRNLRGAVLRAFGALAVCAALVAGVAALWSDGSSQLAIDAQVVSSGDPLRIGATTEVKLQITNRADHEIQPRFAVTWLPNPVYWRITSGPRTLAAGASATYELAAPSFSAAPYEGDTFQFRITDGAGTAYATTESIVASPDEQVLANPEMKLWSQRDGAPGLSSPAGWFPYQQINKGDEASIEPATALGIDAVRFYVSQDGQTDPGGWSHLGLAQEITFPSQPFVVRVLSNTRYEVNEADWPLTAFGIEVSDGLNGRVWILLQPSPSGNREYDLPNGQHVSVIDVPAGQWVSRTIDLAQLYATLRWTPQENISLRFFAAASSRKQTEVEGFIAGVSSDEHSGRSAPAATP